MCVCDVCITRKVNIWLGFNVVNMPRDETGDMLYDMDVSYMETWPVMEEAVDAGLTRHIGLSNFNSQQINEVYEAARIKPAVLQIESHPYLTQQKLIAHCEAKNIIVTAYSPLGSPDRPWAKPGMYSQVPVSTCLYFTNFD